MKEFLEYLIKHLVDKPDAVRVNEVESEQMIIYELHVEKSDIGKVIGKKGSHAYAIRILLNAASKKAGKRAMLEIMD